MTRIESNIRNRTCWSEPGHKTKKPKGQNYTLDPDLISHYWSGLYISYFCTASSLEVLCGSYFVLQEERDITSGVELSATRSGCWQGLIIHLDFWCLRFQQRFLIAIGCLSASGEQKCCPDSTVLCSQKFLSSFLCSRKLCSLCLLLNFSLSLIKSLDAPRVNLPGFFMIFSV